jgi:hypothetical protein
MRIQQIENGRNRLYWRRRCGSKCLTTELKNVKGEEEKEEEIILKQ